MKKGWTLKTFDEIGKITNGNSINEKIKEEKYTSVTDGLAYIATKDISYDSKINYLNGIIIPNEDLKNFKIAKINSLLICSEGGSAGRKFAMTNQDICFVNKLFAVETKKDVIPKILLYYFNSSIFQNEFKERLTGLIGGVSINKFKTIPIPVAPLSEQHAIVEKLDFVFDAIEKAKANIEKNIENAKELFQSKLNAIFSQKGEGWEEKKLSEVFKMKSGVNLTSKMMKPDGEFPVFGGNNIAGYYDDYNFESGVIVGRVGALCGNVRFIDRKIWITDNAFKLTDFRFDLDFQFLTYLLNFKNLREYARQTAQPVISNSSLKDVILSFPKSTTEQQKIVTQLNLLSDQTNLLQEKYKNKLANLDELKRSILEKAFKGELV